jgi:hypothetical protein
VRPAAPPAGTNRLPALGGAECPARRALAGGRTLRTRQAGVQTGDEPAAELRDPGERVRLAAAVGHDDRLVAVRLGTVVVEPPLVHPPVAGARRGSPANVVPPPSSSSHVPGPTPAGGSALKVAGSQSSRRRMFKRRPPPGRSWTRVAMAAAARHPYSLFLSIVISPPRIVSWGAAWPSQGARP